MRWARKLPPGGVWSAGVLGEGVGETRRDVGTDGGGRGIRTAVVLAVIADHQHDLPLENVAVAHEPARDARYVLAALHLPQLPAEQRGGRARARGHCRACLSAACGWTGVPLQGRGRTACVEACGQEGRAMMGLVAVSVRSSGFAGYCPFGRFVGSTKGYAGGKGRVGGVESESMFSGGRWQLAGPEGWRGFRTLAAFGAGAGWVLRLLGAARSVGRRERLEPWSYLLHIHGVILKSVDYSHSLSRGLADWITIWQGRCTRDHDAGEARLGIKLLLHDSMRCAAESPSSPSGGRSFPWPSFMQRMAEGPGPGSPILLLQGKLPTNPAATSLQAHGQILRE